LLDSLLQETQFLVQNNKIEEKYNIQIWNTIFNMLT